MASPAVDIGTGATLTFASYSAQLTSMDWSGISRESIETSHLGTAAASSHQFGNRTYVPGDLIDPGSLSVTGHLNPDTDVPMGSVAESCTLTFAGGATWAGSAFFTDFSVTNPLEAVLEFTATLKFSGPVTITADT